MDWLRFGIGCGFVDVGFRVTDLSEVSKERGVKNRPFLSIYGLMELDDVISFGWI